MEGVYSRKYSISNLSINGSCMPVCLCVHFTLPPSLPPSLSLCLPPSLPPSFFQVLRLHLKRFRFSGLTWQKITVGMAFPLELDLQPFYMSCNQEEEEVDIFQSCDHFLYDLSGVVVHHGLGFSRGHYTAYCWNGQAGERAKKRERERETEREKERQRERERERERQREDQHSLMNPIVSVLSRAFVVGTISHCSAMYMYLTVAPLTECHFTSLFTLVQYLVLSSSAFDRVGYMYIDETEFSNAVVGVVLWYTHIPRPVTQCSKFPGRTLPRVFECGLPAHLVTTPEHHQ